jgi:hypothetical protein
MPIPLSASACCSVLFVATIANQVWAFDADAPEGKDLLWKTSLGKPFRPAEGRQPDGHRSTAIDWWGINILWGILSTPVIDLDAKRMYLVNWVTGADNLPVLFLHGIDLKDEKEIDCGVGKGGNTCGVRIQATLLDDKGAPAVDANGKPVNLFPDQKQRAALLLTPLRGKHKTLFVATVGGENPGDPHGWLIAFDIDSFRPRLTMREISTP